MANISIDALGNAISKELTMYSNSVTEAIKNEALLHAKELVKETKRTAPVGNRKKHYRDSISATKSSETYRSVTYSWYVKGADYRLTHLLEDGHATRDGGYVEGTHFVSKASEPILADFEEKIEEILKNGN